MSVLAADSDAAGGDKYQSHWVEGVPVSKVRPIRDDLAATLVQFP